MEIPGRMQLLQTVQHICVQHGFDRQTFVSLIEEIYGKTIESPEQATQYQLQQFLMASLKWACPPDTPGMQSRRAAAKASWAGAAEDRFSAAA